MSLYKSSYLSSQRGSWTCFMKTGLLVIEKEEVSWWINKLHICWVAIHANCYNKYSILDLHSLHNCLDLSRWQYPVDVTFCAIDSQDNISKVKYSCFDWVTIISFYLRQITYSRTVKSCVSIIWWFEIARFELKNFQAWQDFDQEKSKQDGILIRKRVSREEYLSKKDIRAGCPTEKIQTELTD